MCLGMCKYIYVMQVQKCKLEGIFLRIPEILKLDRNALSGNTKHLGTSLQQR